MYSVGTRLNTVSGSCLTVLFILVGLFACSSSFYTTLAPASVDVGHISIIQDKQYRFEDSQDALKVRFNLNYDFSNVFHWNAKQVFLYVVMSYESDTFKKNDVVIWDRIIETEGEQTAILDNIPQKYRVFDPSKRFPGKSATLRAHWNIVPHAGRMIFGSSPNISTFSFPNH